MKPKILISVAFLLSIAGAAMAQNWGSDASKAQEQYAIMTDAVKAKNYKEAQPALTYLLKNAPELNKSLYINGQEVYEGLVAQTTDPKQLAVYQDSALIMYDLRMKYFQDEANVINRKGLKAYTYLINREGKVDELYTMYKKILETSGDATYNANAQALMDLACRKKTAGSLTDEQVLADYDKINALTEKKLASNDAGEKQAWTQTKEYIDQMLSSCVKIDCNFVKTKMGPKFQQNPQDAELAKQIFGLMATGKCTDDPLFIQAGETLVKKEPSYGVYRVLATVSEGKNEHEKAAQFYEESIKYAGNNEEKAKSYNDVAQIQARKGAKSNARNYYLKAAQLGDASAYTSIGNLYLGSYKECGGNDPIKGKLVYISAYEMYEKAGDKANMAKARQYFPSAEEIFTQGMTEKIGTQMNTGCWINEAVTLQKK